MHKEIKIFFVGEEAQDAGGVFKEWIHLVLKELFNSYTSGKSESELMMNTTKKRNNNQFRNPTLKSAGLDLYVESGRNPSEL
jgi:hypothetical protein